MHATEQMDFFRLAGIHDELSAASQQIVQRRASGDPGPQRYGTPRRIAKPVFCTLLRDVKQNSYSGDTSEAASAPSTPPVSAMTSAFSSRA